MRITSFFALLLLFACGSTKTIAPIGEKPLYEILTQQNHGGAGIQFYEILSERSEINMLLADPNLKDKISSDDISNSNFLILNMGSKPTGGYSITVDSVLETADKIIVSIKEIVPEPDSMNTTAITRPYTLVKINSKKPIEFK